VAAILQLAVFGALAAFTTSFDITSNLGGNAEDPNQVRADQIQLQFGTSTQAGLDAMEYVQERLPGLNFRGIAMTMAWSRVLLMAQYIIGEFFYSVPSRK
jgi:hypothetical protein